jgi:hypothetical protein
MDFKIGARDITFIFALFSFTIAKVKMKCKNDNNN